MRKKDVRMNDDERLLKEFDSLIDTIGTEVSSRISEQVSKEATRTLIKETIFSELMQVQRNIVKLLQETPKATQQIDSSTKELEQSNQTHKGLLTAQEEQTKKLKEINDIANLRINDAIAKLRSTSDIANHKLNDSIAALKASKIEQLLEKQNRNQDLQAIINTQQSLFMKLEKVNENLANLMGTCARLEGKINRLNTAVSSLEKEHYNASKSNDVY